MTPYIMATHLAYYASFGSHTEKGTPRKVFYTKNNIELIHFKD